MAALERRRSVRAFDGRPVDEESIRRLITAATLAPSRMNSQPWRFHVATGSTLRRVSEAMALSTAHAEEYLAVLGHEGVERVARFYADLGKAPAVIGISAPRTEDSFEARDDAISIGAALENLLLAACDAGLGACSLSVPRWVADRLAQVLQVPDDREVVLLVAIGYPDETPPARERRTDVVTFLR